MKTKKTELTKVYQIVIDGYWQTEPGDMLDCTWNSPNVYKSYEDAKKEMEKLIESHKSMYGGTKIEEQRKEGYEQCSVVIIHRTGLYERDIYHVKELGIL